MKKRKTQKYNTKMNQGDLPRIWFHKEKKRGRTTIVPGYIIKCGCCDGKITIDDFGTDLDINGVMTRKEIWAQILLPLLKVKK